MTNTRRKPEPLTEAQVERAIADAYSPTELRRLVQRLQWAADEMQELRRRVPQVHEFRIVRRALQDLGAPPAKKLTAESRAALDWLMGTLGPRRAADTPSPRVLLRLVQSGHLRASKRRSSGK